VFSVAHRHTRAALPKTFAKGCGGLDGVTLLGSVKSDTRPFNLDAAQRHGQQFSQPFWPFLCEFLAPDPIHDA
jgi:hypothetical protein